MDMTRGNQQLAEWLRQDETPTQRELARRLGMQQPVVSRHANAHQPGLRFILAYQLLAGVPVEAWLREDEKAWLEGVRREFPPPKETGAPTLLRARRQVSKTRQALEGLLATAPEGQLPALRAACQSLHATEAALSS